MSDDSVEDLVRSADNVVELFRTNDLKFDQYIFPPEYSHWIEEQRAVRETCALVDQSFHMETLRIDGPDATSFLESICINSFEKVREGVPPQAINIVMCNPDGYIIGDQILFYVDTQTFRSVGSVWANNWIRFNASRTDLDLNTEIEYSPHGWEEDPAEFRFQIQGPFALDVMEEATDHQLPHIPFFRMDSIEIDGIETLALGHGMAATPGLEIFGPYKHHGEILERLLDVGSEYDLRRMGTKAYKTGKIGSGWIVVPVPAIFESSDMREYREWLPADGWEGELSIGGSFVSNDISDYYMTPIERGQGHLIDFEHEFIGRDALSEFAHEERRERVTFVWNSEDVVDVYASLFADGETKKFIDLPDTATQWSTTHYDAVMKHGDIVGVSKYPGYLYYERSMLSLGTIDAEYSEPGTEVTMLWGDTSGKRRVERHEPTEIRATVAVAPYVRGGRRDMSAPQA